MSDDDLIRRGDALRVADEVFDQCENVHGDDRGAFAAAEVGARIAALPAVTVGVKPLVWEESLKGRWIGTPVVKLGDLAFWVFHREDGTFMRATKDGGKLHPSLDAAKAAAQADYEARILAALAPTDAPDTDLLFDAYKGLLVLHRTLDRMGLARGSATASRIADKIVAAHPEFPARTALRHTEEPK